MGNGQAGIDLGKKHLIQHFKGFQAANQAANGGSAESAAHGTAHFRGNTDGIAVVVTHQNGFHTVPVGKLPQVFDGAILFGFLFANHVWGIDGVMLRQGIPQPFGQIGHFVVGTNALMKPAVNLLRPEGRLAQLF